MNTNKSSKVENIWIIKIRKRFVFIRVHSWLNFFFLKYISPQRAGDSHDEIENDPWQTAQIIDK